MALYQVIPASVAMVIWMPRLASSSKPPVIPFPGALLFPVPMALVLKQLLLIVGRYDTRHGVSVVGEKARRGDGG